MSTKLLLPIDGSNCCNAFLKLAGPFIPKEKSDVYLLSVGCNLPADYPLQASYSSAFLPVLEKSKVFMEELGCRVVKADYIETVGPVGHAICAYADSCGIDLIMMGAHGKTGLSNLLMGSVSQDVFRHAKQPVVVFNMTRIPSLHISHIDQIRPEFITTICSAIPTEP